MHVTSDANHYPQITVNGAALLENGNGDDKVVHYQLRANPDSNAQDTLRAKQLLNSEHTINKTLNICATMQCFFASCFIAIGVYMTIAQAWGYQSGSDYIAAISVTISGGMGYRAARTKCKATITWNCLLAWSVFTLVYIPMFLVGLLGAFLSLHHPFLSDYEYPTDTMTMLFHGANTIVAMFGLLITLVQATIKTNKKIPAGHYTKTVSPVILTVCDNRPSPLTKLLPAQNNSNHLIVHHHEKSSEKAKNSRSLNAGRNYPTYSDIITRI